MLQVTSLWTAHYVVSPCTRSKFTAVHTVGRLERIDTLTCTGWDACKFGQYSVLMLTVYLKWHWSQCQDRALCGFGLSLMPLNFQTLRTRNGNWNLILILIKKKKSKQKKKTKKKKNSKLQIEIRSEFWALRDFKAECAVFWCWIWCCLRLDFTADLSKLCCWWTTTSRTT